MNEITLTSYNMGNVTEADYDGWVAFVTEKLSSEAGVEVEVDAAPFGRGGESDRVSADSAEDERAIRLAMVELWERWCASEGIRLNPRS